jgi:hypothetical protein
LKTVKNTATPTSITEFKNTNNVILLPLSSCGILKYRTLKSIVTDSNKNITEKHVANLCIQNRLFFFQNLKSNTINEGHSLQVSDE